MISIRGLRARLNEFSLDVPELSIGHGQYFILLGPTGSGKTSLLRCLAGLQRHEGSILFGDADMSGIPPERRGAGYVPQDYKLFPFLTVRENILFGARPGETADFIDRLVSMLDLGPALSKRPDMLSGGEKQRAAFARALATRPKLLLLDEPFASLDAGLRRKLWLELPAMYRSAVGAVVHVTHDLDEAFALADRIGVIIGGRVVQCGSKEEVFYRPKNAAVAGFLGLRNVFRGRVGAPGPSSIPIDCEGAVIAAPLRSGCAPGSEVSLCIHPDDIKVIRDGEPLRESLKGNVFEGHIARVLEGVTTTTAFLMCASNDAQGAGVVFEFRVPSRVFNRMGLGKDRRAVVAFTKESVHVLDAQT